MNQESMQLLHDAREKLATVRELVHMHMSGDRRYEALRLMEDVSDRLNKMYVKCLQCDDDDRRET